MNEEEKKDIYEMTEIAKYLAGRDPQALSILKSSAEVLKARFDLEAFGEIEHQSVTA